MTMEVLYAPVTQISFQRLITQVGALETGVPTADPYPFTPGLQTNQDTNSFADGLGEQTACSAQSWREEITRGAVGCCDKDVSSLKGSVCGRGFDSRHLHPGACIKVSPKVRTVRWCLPFAAMTETRGNPSPRVGV